ncbi:MAG TPA: CGNR zinc finger domain-containing protein [Solirubrobacteraceae bacterium]|nr:CGNR zinc finger domain-containing protein [Solirubrobacteraceae bacterium]
MSEVPAYRERDEAPGERRHLSLALANSRRNTPEGPLDELASPASLRAWLSARGFEQIGRCGPAQVVEFRLLRDAIRELLEARIQQRLPERTAVALVNRAASAAPSVSQLRWDAGGPPEVVDRPGGRGTAVARAVIAADAIELIAGEEHADLRACGAPGCVRLLLRDHPRRQWCSTRCGDRVRASRYYHRHRDG